MSAEKKVGDGCLQQFFEMISFLGLLIKAVLVCVYYNMSFQDYEKNGATFFEDREDQRRWEVQCDIRKQVWTEMYDVFGWMYLNDKDYQEAITEEVDRRVALHFEKEKQILALMDEKPKDVPAHVPDDKDLVHLVEIDVSSPKTQEKEVLDELNEPRKQWEESDENKKDQENVFEAEKRMWQEKLDEDVKRWIQETQNGKYEW